MLEVLTLLRPALEVATLLRLALMVATLLRSEVVVLTLVRVVLAVFTLLRVVVPVPEAARLDAVLRLPYVRLALASAPRVVTPALRVTPLLVMFDA